MDRTKNEKMQRWYLRTQDFLESNLSQAAWCKEKGIPTSTFQYWYKKIQEGQRREETGLASWLELRSTAEPDCRDLSVSCTKAAADSPMRPITFSYGGFRMEILPDTPMETVQGMLRMMRSV